jgi:hypothetical protein
LVLDSPVPPFGRQVAPGPSSFLCYLVLARAKLKSIQSLVRTELYKHCAKS